MYIPDSDSEFLDIWGIHPKGHRCHKFDVTQMFQSLHSH